MPTLWFFKGFRLRPILFLYKSIMPCLPILYCYLMKKIVSLFCYGVCRYCNYHTCLIMSMFGIMRELIVAKIICDLHINIPNQLLHTAGNMW